MGERDTKDYFPFNKKPHGLNKCSKPTFLIISKFSCFPQMIQNFQEEACFILDTMKGNKIVSRCLSLSILRAFFMVYSSEETGKVSTTVSEGEKVTSVEIAPFV